MRLYALNADGSRELLAEGVEPGTAAERVYARLYEDLWREHCANRDRWFRSTLLYGDDT